MPKLPGPESLGGIPSPNVNVPIARIDTSPLGEGIARFGAQVAAVGSRLQEGWQQVQALNTETEFQKFQFDEEQKYAEAVRNMQPGQAAGFTERYRSEYAQRAKEFSTNHLGATDPVTHGKYDLRLFDIEKRIFDDAYKFEHEEQYRSANASVDDALNNAILPRAQMAARLPTGDPRKRVLADEAIADAERIIDANPAYTPIQKEEEKRKRRGEVQTRFLEALPPQERLELDPSSAPAQLADRIVQVESGGRANAKNKLSSATGAGQFIDSTWLTTIKRHRPDIAEGRSDSQLLALRGNKALSREMVAAYASDNAAYLQLQGLPVTAGTLYLAHFAGAGGADGLLSADPNTPAVDVLGEAVIKANPFLKGKNAGQVIAWAEKKMGMPIRGGGWSEWADGVSFDDRQKIASTGAADIQKQSTAHYGDVLLGIRTGQIRDPNVILQDPNLTPFHQAQLVQAWESENKEGLAQSAAVGRVMNGDSFNPYNTEDRKAADAYYKTLGGSEGLLTGDAEAVNRLAGTIAQTGILPAEALAALRGGLDSTDSATLGNTLSVLSGIYGANPRAFEPYDGGAGLRDAAAAFAHLTQDRGLSGEEAAQKFAESRNPERRANAKLLETGANAMVKKLKVGDVTNAFDLGPFYAEPSAGYTPEMEAALLADYQEIAREKYLESGGNEDIAKAQALAEMKRLYGVSEATGRRVLMKYPPENYYPAIDGSHDYLRLEAFKDAGADLNPNVKEVFLVPSRETAEDIRAGRLPRYRLFWISEQNGQPIINEATDSLFEMPADKLKALTDAEKARRAGEAGEAHEGAVRGRRSFDELKSTVPLVPQFMQ